MYSISEFKRKLASDNDWAVRSIVVLYEYQTKFEQKVKTTTAKNRVGFNIADAKVLSTYAKQIADGIPLSNHQLIEAHLKLPKYAKQLWEIAYPSTEIK